MRALIRLTLDWDCLVTFCNVLSFFNLFNFNFKCIHLKRWAWVFSQRTIYINIWALRWNIIGFDFYYPLTKKTFTIWWANICPVHTKPATISTTKFIIPLIFTDCIFKRYCLLYICWINAQEHVIHNSSIKLNPAIKAKIVHG